MKIQYKPSKPQKVKTSKPAKAPKAPKAPKAEKLQNFGSVKTVKFDKPKKVKEPKLKVPKSEKPVAISLGKAEKVKKADGAKLKKSANLKIVAVALVAVVVVMLAVVLLPYLKDNEMVVKPMLLSVACEPNKTVYYVGETPTFAGLKLQMTYTNDAVITIDGSDCEIVGFDSSKPEESQVITVKYKELQTTFCVTIQEIPLNNPDALYTGISMKTLPNKTTYKVGEWPDATGGVFLVHYDDGSTREIALTNDHIYDFTTAEPGQITITVKYVEQGRYGETTYTITVTE